MRARPAFVSTMNRVDGVIALHKPLHGKSGRPRQHVSDMLRGALVLAVGALDGLVLEAVIEVVAPAARAGKLGDAAIKWARDEPAKVLMAFAEEDPHEELAALARSHLGQITFQRSKMIEGVLWDVAEIPAPWPTAALSLSDPKDKWDADRVCQQLDEVVLRRHRIAHAGDLRADARSATPITVAYVTSASRLIRAVGYSVCDEVDSALRELRRAARS
jgi:hypothetical protein